MDLFLMELTNWRWSWRTIALTSAIAPMLSIIALGSFAQGSGRETLAYILTGNLVMALMFGNLDNVASRLVYMRFAGTLDYQNILEAESHPAFSRWMEPTGRIYPPVSYKLCRI
jgi:ABC-2 type transport system permease protein